MGGALLAGFQKPLSLKYSRLEALIQNGAHAVGFPPAEAFRKALIQKVLATSFLFRWKTHCSSLHCSNRA